MRLTLITLGIIFFSAWTVRRLLGITRGRWLSTFLAALLGQAAALGILQSVTGDFLALPTRWYPVGITLAVVLSMAVFVVVEMFVRPRPPRGFVLPHPVSGAQRRLQRAARYVQVSRIALRRGLLRPAGTDTEVSGSRLGRSLAATLEEAGGLFVKLGQAMAAQPRLVTPAVAAELARLNDQVVPADARAALQVIHDEIGDPATIFADFAPEPVAAASIGQTYFATLLDGREVVVKVQRPGIRESVERDLDILDRLAETLHRRAAWARSIGLRELAAGFAEATREELDFRLEAANTTAARDSLLDSDDLMVPGVVAEFTTGRVMVQERVPGRGIGGAGALDDLDADRREALADGFLRLMVRQMTNGEKYHADPHPGNVLVREDGRLALIDFGSVGRLDRYERAALVDIFRGLQTEDPTLLRQAALRIGTRAGRVDAEALDRELGRQLARSLQPGENLDPGIFADVVFVFRDFGISLPRSTTTLFRALAIAISTLDVISPSYDLIKAVRGLEGGFVPPLTSPRTVKEFVQREVLSSAPVLARLPRDVDDVARSLVRGDLRLRVSLFSEPEDVKAVRGIVNLLTTGLVGSALVLASAVLMTVEPGPGQLVGLVRSVGAVGFAFATLLLLRVIVRLLNERER